MHSQREFVLRQQFDYDKNSQTKCDSKCGEKKMQILYETFLWRKRRRSCIKPCLRPSPMSLCCVVVCCVEGHLTTSHEPAAGPGNSPRHTPGMFCSLLVASQGRRQATGWSVLVQCVFVIMRTGLSHTATTQLQHQLSAATSWSYPWSCSQLRVGNIVNFNIGLGVASYSFSITKTQKQEVFFLFQKTKIQQQ